MVRMTESSFLSSDGKHKVYYRKYTPEGEPKGILQLVHGFSGHIGRYDGFARVFCEKGYIVVGDDHLGHGQSIIDGLPAWVADVGGWETMVEDLHILHRLVRQEHPGLPCYLFGHSMGSILCRTYMIRFRGSLDGVILCGTSHQSPRMLSSAYKTSQAVCRFKGTKASGKPFFDFIRKQYMRGFPDARTEFDWLNRSADGVDSFLSDPFCQAVPTMGFIRDMLGGMLFMEKSRNMERMTKELPVYFISGDKDPVGENGKGVMRAYKAFLKAGMKDVTMKLYAGARHQLWDEENRDEVIQDILSWLDAKSGRAGY